jgi:two-component system, sensor histidine kinase and response regulator
MVFWLATSRAAASFRGAEGFWRDFALFVLLLWAYVTPVWSTPVGLALTNEERNWLKSHPRIQMGIMDAWPPLNYVDKNGTPQGIGVDYAAALNKRLGGALILVPGPFNENYQRVLDGKLDALMDITQRPDREALFSFTRPYIDIPHVIVGRKGGDYFAAERDLAGKTIALERGFHNVVYFKEKFPSVAIKEYASTADALDAVSRGDADAYAGNRAVVVYLVEKELLNNLRLMGKLTEPRSILQFGVRKDRIVLATILDKALASLTPEEEFAIQRKWVLGDTATPEFTQGEQEWLKSHPVIKVAIDPNWAPIEFLDAHGIPQGISVDYLRRMSEFMGVHFEYVEGKNWQTLLEKGERGDVDLFPSLLRTRELEPFFAFSDIYLSLPIGIFTRKDAPYISALSDLTRNKIAVVQGHGAEFLLKTSHPELAIIPVGSTEDALRQLEKGRVDALVDCTMITSHHLEKLKMTEIKLGGEISERYEQRMGVRRDWPELVTILNKALRAIPRTERDAIYTRASALGHGPQIDYSLIWKVIAGALIVVALFAFWNWRMEREIAKRKKVMEALADALDEQRAILEAATSGIILAQNRLIIRANHKSETIFGYEQGEMLGQTTRIWYSDEETFQEIGKGVTACMAKGEVFSRELQLVHKDGTRFWGRMKFQATDPADFSKGVVGVIDDVTVERENAEALRNALEAAEAADRIKSAFLATMSHELRTPLNSIIGFTGLLLQGIVGPLNVEQKKQLGMVRDSSTHLLELINDVLDISKIEAGQLEVATEPFDLRSSLEKTAHTLHPLADRRGISLHLEIGPEIGILQNDRRRVEQVLLNLGSNAVKFTDEGGVRIECSALGDEVEVRVRDTGIGISPEGMQTLFLPFRQVDSGTTRKYEGTGLGLSICKRLVELMGGRIRVESTVGEGSLFAFTLPIKRGKP